MKKTPFDFGSLGLEPSDHIMTIQEAADYTGYKVSYLYRLSHTRDIPVFRLPNRRKLFFSKRSLDAWILSKENYCQTNAELAIQALTYCQN